MFELNDQFAVNTRRNPLADNNLVHLVFPIVSRDSRQAIFNS